MVRFVQHVWTVFLILVLTAPISSTSAEHDRSYCEFCGGEILTTVFITTDKVTGQKYLICAGGVESFTLDDAR